MRSVSLDFDFDNGVVTYNGRKLAIYEMLDTNGDETDVGSSAAFVTFGEEGFGWLSFDLEANAFVEVDEGGELRLVPLVAGVLQ